MDAATSFLVRKDRKALDARLKKEKARIIVQARLDGQVGLLAATAKRIVFVHKLGWRYRMVEILGKDLARLTERRTGHGEVHITTKAGGSYAFAMLQRGAGEAFCETVRPTPPMRAGQSVQTRKGGPMQFIPKQGKPAPGGAPMQQHPRGSGHDPLSASKQEKLARLEKLHKLGRIGKAEYEWQKDALERS